MICLGLLLDAKGEKMSKSRGNSVDPWQLMDTYGADATRWYMCASGPPYNPRNFSSDYVNEVLRQFLLTLWNTYSFFVLYANVDGWQPPGGANPLAGIELQPIDRWALARLNELVSKVTTMLEAYDIHGPAKEIERFVEDLSNWYVRRNRRFWKPENDSEKQAAYLTLYTCLATLSRLLAPFMPFASEALYRNLVAEQDPGAPESVHLASWPGVNDALLDKQLLADAELLLETVSLARSARRSANVRVRQPLKELLLRTPRNGAGLRRFADELRDELNVKKIRFLEVGDELVTYRFKPNLPVLGKKYGRLIPKIKTALESLQGGAALAAAHALEEDQPIEVQVDGQTLWLEPAEVLVEATSPVGYAVAEGNGVLVALDTTLTPELRLEGQARDLVRFIQDARKAAGFAITDRIHVTLQPQEGFDIKPMLAAQDDYIRSETLASSLDIGATEEGDYTMEAELEDGVVVVGVRREL